MQGAEARITGYAGHRGARCRRLSVKVVRQRLEAGIVGKVGQGDLAERRQFCGRPTPREHFSGLVDDDLSRVLRNRDLRLQEIPVDRNDLAVGILVEGTGPRIEGLAVFRLDLKPTASVDRQIEVVSGLR